MKRLGVTRLDPAERAYEGIEPLPERVVPLSAQPHSSTVTAV
jgi:hypothetical protein